MGYRVFVLKSEQKFENFWSFSRNAGNLWWIIFLNILLRLGSSDIGLELLQFSLSSFFYIGIILVFFIEFGNLPLEKLMQLYNWVLLQDHLYTFSVSLLGYYLDHMSRLYACWQ